jgi:hypothetical protein
VQRKDWAECERLITSDEGPALLRHKNRTGQTPIMMAVNGACGGKKGVKNRMIDLMLAHGAAETLGEI